MTKVNTLRRNNENINKGNKMGVAIVKIKINPDLEPAGVVPAGVVQVLNCRTKTVHLCATTGTACNSWGCGSPLEPHKQADFAQSTTRWGSDAAVNFCRQCYSLRVISRIGGTLRVEGTDVGSSSSSSETSSS